MPYYTVGMQGINIQKGHYAIHAVRCQTATLESHCQLNLTNKKKNVFIKT